MMGGHVCRVHTPDQQCESGLRIIYFSVLEEQPFWGKRWLQVISTHGQSGENKPVPYHPPQCRDVFVRCLMVRAIFTDSRILT